MTWRAINSVLSPGGCNHNKSQIKNIICNNTVYSGEHAIAEKMYNYFTSVGPDIARAAQLFGIDPLSYLRGSYPTSFFYAHVSSVDVQNAIVSLKSKTAARQ